jgi:hypothetical protein
MYQAFKVSAVEKKAVDDDDAWYLEHIKTLIEASEDKSVSSRNIGRSLRSIPAVGGEDRYAYKYLYM